LWCEVVGHEATSISTFANCFGREDDKEGELEDMILIANLFMNSI